MLLMIDKQHRDSQKSKNVQCVMILDAKSVG
jgi:hypothetical protein